MRATILLAALGGATAELIADEFSNPGASNGYSSTLTSISGVVGPIITTVKAHATYQTFSYSLTNVDPACSNGPTAATDSCAIVFSDSRKCSAPGSHYYQTGAADPWTKPNNIIYTSSGSGASALSVTVPTGIPENDLHGKTVIVHAQNGDKIGCAVIWDPIFITRLQAVPRVSQPNCANILKIAAGTEKAVPIDVVGTDHQKAGTLRSIPLLTKENCAKAFPFGVAGNEAYHRG